MGYLERLKRILRGEARGFIPYRKARFQAYKRHILARIEATPVGREPYFHLYIDRIFPDELYRAIEKRMLYCRDHRKVRRRDQDSAVFVNRRFNLRRNIDPETRYLRNLFSDPDIKRAFLSKFYVDANQALVDAIKIHDEEFEFVYTAPGLFQNIHTDIPPKFLSMVFYIPGREVTADDADRNGTIFYDKDLVPNSKAKYLPNSVGIFAQHFHSYHGFASTVERPALVLFYVHPEVEKAWNAVKDSEGATFDEIRDQTAAKLVTYPLIEYGTDRSAIETAWAECRINAPSGRVMVDKPKMLEPAREKLAV